jgi:hypothetical protein
MTIYFSIMKIVLSASEGLQGKLKHCCVPPLVNNSLPHALVTKNVKFAYLVIYIYIYPFSEEIFTDDNFSLLLLLTIHLKILKRVIFFYFHNLTFRIGLCV